MARLLYITNTSLDGYIEDVNGSFDWGNPDQTFDFITQLLQPVGTHLLGRKLAETMAFWNAPVESYPPEHRDFASVWQRAEKIVFSRKTRLFDPETIRKLKAESGRDFIIGGAELAGAALEADLLDECQVFLNPVILGAGKPALRTSVQRDLELLETRSFTTGVVYLRYRVKGLR